METDPKKIAQDVFAQNLSDSQYAVSPVPYHTHNGTDAPVIAPLNQVFNLISLPTVITSASLSDNPLFKLTATQNFTMANPTGGIDGQKIIYKIKQDGTGSRLITWGSAFRGLFSATGGTITTSAGNTIHTFNSTGSFTISGLSNVSLSYLIVGGGGAGHTGEAGTSRGGGGGSGGMLTGTVTLGPGAYSVVVGSGGLNAGTTTAGSVADNGYDSLFAGFTALGGGGGGLGGNGRNGGSGGGANGGGTTGGTGSQGSNGGNGAGNAGSGGGGNTSAGGTASGDNITGANGGNGTASSISGASVTYAGGGGGGGSTTGGTGGTGGGGAGGSNAAGTSGTANTGGGGGGAGSASGAGGSGGSGVVIISYPTASNLPILSTAANAVDYFEFVLDSVTGYWNLLLAVLGYSS